jgi:hypothetical protein
MPFVPDDHDFKPEMPKYRYGKKKRPYYDTSFLLKAMFDRKLAISAYGGNVVHYQVGNKTLCGMKEPYIRTWTGRAVEEPIYYHPQESCASPICGAPLYKVGEELICIYCNNIRTLCMQCKRISDKVESELELLKAEGWEGAFDE